MTSSRTIPLTRSGLFFRGPWVLAICLLACDGGEGEAPSAEAVIADGGRADSGAADAGSPAPSERFSLVVIADPHITSESERDGRLRAAVDWINAEATARQIELALVVGDIGWGPGVERSKAMLDGLSIPYVPILGDNAVVSGDGETFQTVFAPQFALLAETFADWAKAPTPVFDGALNQDVWLCNFSFSHRGITFVGLDWNSRAGGSGLSSEMGTLHPGEGGSLAWLTAALDAHAGTPADSLVMGTHIPMHVGGFTVAEMATLEGVIGTKAAAVYGNLAGHVHINYETPVGEGLYTVFVTDATFEDELTLRVVAIAGDATGYRYTHELVELPW